MALISYSGAKAGSMTNVMRRLGTLFLALAVITVCPVVPASAISVELAKKCRDMAVKAHPPPIRLGNKAYAQAERDFFARCVAHNGNIENPDTSKNSDTGK
jgi:curli biogenesis system outer membrane secretion channel CsgG